MLKGKKGNTTIHHNIPFLSEVIPKSISKFRKDNIRIFSVLINENSICLASVFFSIRALEQAENLF